jgi:hypothetical protein
MDAKNIKINLNNATYEQTKEIPILLKRKFKKTKPANIRRRDTEQLITNW